MEIRNNQIDYEGEKNKEIFLFGWRDKWFLFQFVYILS
jgi:hypothetical protein